MRTLCASTLLSEFVIIGLAALVADRMSEAGTGTIWAVSGPAMLLCVVLSGLAGRPGTVPLGWALQAGLVASGLVVPAMFLLGAVFAALWGASVHFGRKVDDLKAAHAARAPGAPSANAAAPATD